MNNLDLTLSVQQDLLRFLLCNKPINTTANTTTTDPTDVIKVSTQWAQVSDKWSHVLILLSSLYSVNKRHMKLWHTTQRDFRC